MRARAPVRTATSDLWISCERSDLVGNYMASPPAQAALAAANGRFPANTTAGKQVNDPLLWKAIGNMPPILLQNRDGATSP